MRVGSLVLLGAIVLGLLSFVQMQVLALALDHSFAWLSWGAASLGLSLGVAGCSIPLPFFRRLAPDAQIAAMGTAAASLLAAASLTVQDVLVLEGGAAFAAFFLTMILPYAIWAYGVYRLYRAGGIAMGPVVGAAAVGAVIGMVLASTVDVLPPVQLAWCGAALMAFIAVVAARDRAAPVLVGALVIVAGLAFHYVATGDDDMPQWSPQADAPITKPMRVWPKLTPVADGSPTVWHPFARADRLRRQDLPYDVIFSNGTAPVLEPATDTHLPTKASLERDFPVYALAVALRSSDTLIIEPVAGPDAGLSVLQGTRRVRVLGYSPAARALGAWPVKLSGHATTEFATFYGDVRQALRTDSSRYGLVLLTLTHSSNSPWIGSDAQSGYLATQQAFQQYWDHLEGDGILAVVTTSPTLFARSVLTAAHLSPGSRGNVRLADRLWGFEISSAAPVKWPYRNLLLVFKTPPGPEAIKHMRERIERSHLITLFGAGESPVGQYSPLDKAQPLAVTEAELTLGFSRRAGRWLDLTATTDARPSFFRIPREMHPYFAWVLGMAVGLVVFVLLMPMHRLRRIDSPVVLQGLPPIPAYLGYLGLIGGAQMLLVATGIQALSVRGASMPLAFASTGAVVVVGCGLGALFGHRWIRASWRRGSVSIALLAAALAYALSMTIKLEWAGSYWLPATVELLAGFGNGVLIVLALKHVSRVLPSLAPWSWVFLGGAVCVVSTLSSQLGQKFGWDVVAMMVAAAYVILAGLAWWLLKPSPRQVTAVPERGRVASAR